MSNLNTQVRSALEFIPPAFNPQVLQGGKLVLPWWLKFKTSISNIEAQNLETLADLYQQFDAGKARFLMAFRHPSIDDPFCMGQMVWDLLPKAAQKQGITLKSPVHSHFIYDRGIPLWAGSRVGWLYSRLGGTPIMRGRIDRAGLRSARDLFLNGKFPIAASPEGATNGHNERVSPLEPGIAQMGFWCAEDISKGDRSELVFIVPVGIQYSYIDEPWENIEKLLTQLEVDSGLRGDGTTPNATVDPASLEPSALYDRLMRLGGHLLVTMENFYRRFYHENLPETAPNSDSADPNQALAVRMNALFNVALGVAEEYFDLKPKGNLIDRCRRLEQAGWDYIYREDIESVAAISSVEKGLADLIAEEASLRMWHMRLVESFVAVTGSYVKEKPTAERFAETTLLLWNVIRKIKGGNPLSRPSLGKQRVQMTVAEPICVSDRLDAYKASRRSAVADLTRDLQVALEGTIKH
ncbi:MAG: 1-acyl-sn-glycerol-3-phosphate acyltransferase [Cyanobacteriota bacterium]|nr:1-acyl-sn-glycerol-3-phosphate acyltransferase [Cyanobacteriota bacterium]